MCYFTTPFFDRHYRNKYTLDTHALSQRNDDESPSFHFDSIFRLSPSGMGSLLRCGNSDFMLLALRELAPVITRHDGSTSPFLSLMMVVRISELTACDPSPNYDGTVKNVSTRPPECAIPLIVPPPHADNARHDFVSDFSSG